MVFYSFLSTRRHQSICIVRDIACLNKDLPLLLFQDVDECTNNNGRCEQVCNNTIGSFLCDCVTGYRLDGNGLNCSGKLCLLLES